MSLKSKIIKFVGGEFELEPLFYLEGSMSKSEMLIGMIPFVGAFYHLFSDSKDDAKDLDPAYYDKTASGGASAAGAESGGIALGSIKSVLAGVLKIGLIGGLAIGAGGGALSAASGGSPLEGALAPVNAVGSLFGLGIENVDDSVAGNDAAQEVSREAQSLSIFDQFMCLATGDGAAGCVREQSEQRPGSEDVGEEYGLKIENFQVGSGSSFDVSYDDPSTVVPLSFTVRNRMNGRKGIDARDTAFRVKMIDSDRGVEDPYCDTGWLELGQADVDGDGRTDDLAKGQVAGTGFVQIDREYVEERVGASFTRSDRPLSERTLSIENCEMLQPSQGETRRIVLELRYDYFSQARSTFEAMSQEYRRQQELQRTFEPSETANTPAKAVVSLRQPVMFSESEAGRQPEPFATRVTLETEKSDLRYRVTGLKLVKSRVTEIADSEQCSFRQSDSNSLQMNLKPQAADRLVFDSDADQGRPESYYWNNEGDSPAIMGCFFQLSDDPSVLNDISSSGETFAFRALTNYTVAVEEPMDSFEVTAESACDQFECPRLATLNLDSSIQGTDLKTTCEGTDASYRGCSAIGGSSLTAFSDSDPARNLPFDSVVEEGEVAVNLQKALNYQPEDDVDHIAGIEKDRWERIDPNMDGLASPVSQKYRILGLQMDSGEQDVVLEFIQDSQCGADISSSDFENVQGARIIYTNCGEDSTDTQEQDVLASGGEYDVVQLEASRFAPGESFSVDAAIESESANLVDGSHSIWIERRRTQDATYQRVSGSESTCDAGSPDRCSTTASVETGDDVTGVSLKVVVRNEAGRSPTSYNIPVKTVRPS